MNKKHITLILIGILLLLLQFHIHIGTATIDICSDVLAFFLIILGTFPLQSRNIHFKKCRNVSILGLLAAIAGQTATILYNAIAVPQILTLSLGLSTIFTIYYTYYFTEALTLEAKFQEKSAVTRSFRITWFVLGAFLFIHYMVALTNINLASILVNAVTVIIGIYYCTTVFTACKQLYMDGLPTKHMDTTAQKK